MNQIRVILSRFSSRSDLLDLAVAEWGLKTLTSAFKIHQVNQLFVQDVEIDRREVTA